VADHDPATPLERPSIPGHPPLAWLDLTLETLPENLALDEALLSAAEDGAGPCVRVWEWPRVAVVLGASGRIAEDVHLQHCQADGVSLARRSSGGGTVLLGPGALNLNVVLPLDAAPGLAAVEHAQAFVLGRLAASLRDLTGLPVEVQGSGDLTLHDRKVAGSAQRRLRRSFLVHTSILYDFRLENVSRYLAEPRRQPAYREGRDHGAFVANLPVPRPQLLQAIQEAWIGVPRPPRTALFDPARVRQLVQEKFGDPAWIERF
jgi:lipoate-protein ligase A